MTTLPQLDYDPFDVHVFPKTRMFYHVHTFRGGVDAYITTRLNHRTDGNHAILNLNFWDDVYKGDTSSQRVKHCHGHIEYLVQVMVGTSGKNIIVNSHVDHMFNPSATFQVLCNHYGYFYRPIIALPFYTDPRVQDLYLPHLEKVPANVKQALIYDISLYPLAYWLQGKPYGYEAGLFVWFNTIVGVSAETLRERGVGWLAPRQD